MRVVARFKTLFLIFLFSFQFNLFTASNVRGYAKIDSQSELFFDNSEVLIEVINSSIVVEANRSYNIAYKLTELNGKNISFHSVSFIFKTMNLDDFTSFHIYDPCFIELTTYEIKEWIYSLEIPSDLFKNATQNGLNQMILVSEFSGFDQLNNSINVSCQSKLELLQRVAIIVDNSIFDAINLSLEQYILDTSEKFALEYLVFNGTWISALLLRDFLIDIWTNESINGAILIGYLPYVLWEMPNEEICTLPLYFEDLDGTFYDEDLDSYYDYHEWGINDGPEIWISRFMPPRSLIESSYLDAFGNFSQSGLYGEYYSDTSFTSLSTTRIDPFIEFYWSEGTLPASVYPDTFSIRWTGKVFIENTENYTFAPYFGGNLKLWIDDILLISVANPPYKWREYTNSSFLTMGWHDIKIEYIEGGWGLDNNGSIRLCWTSPSILARSLNEYFNKTHLYHTNQMDYVKKALLYMDYTYGVSSNMLEPTLAKLSSIYGDNVDVGGASEFANAQEYLEMLDTGYEVTSVWSHADSTSHQFIPPPESEQTFSAATSWLVRRRKSSIATLIWGCQAGDYSPDPYSRDLTENLAVNYAFGTENGLASLSCTRSFGTSFREVYHAWVNHSFLGLGFFAYLDNQYNQARRIEIDPLLADKWIVGGLLLGDPFIEIQPLPSNLEISINKDVLYTYNRNVTLNLNSRNAEEMSFQENGGIWSDWEPFASTRNWTLTEIDGYKQINFRTKNQFGISPSIASATILQDTTDPILINTEWDESSFSITWVFDDLTPYYYMIYVNNTFQHLTYWYGNPIIESFDYLDDGTYNISIQISDEVGHSSFDSIIVEIIHPITSPIETEKTTIPLLLTMIPIVVITYYRKKKK